MRIISGKLKGKYIAFPKNFHSRPTTDRAREALFSIIDSQYEFDGLKVLDLFFGTGSISLEFISRGSSRVVSVDNNFHSIKHLNKFIDGEKVENIQTLKSDYKTFIQNNQEQFDIIFADPPFDMPEVEEIPDLIFSSDCLTEIGTLIVEHSDRIDFSSHPKFVDLRRYGGVNFSFFEV
ncbi:MAG: RsmD family RNA methyltransferase [Crocinitomicaceae bacterium]|nr:RsmD family RNA methyltransferase [Crocinitomicaceae bacterium]